MGGSKLTAAGVATAVLCGAVASLALAGYTPQSNNDGSSNGINYRSASSGFAGSSGATAACKGKRKVTGGGAELDGSVAEGTLHELDANPSPEASPKKAWTGAGIAVPNGQNIKVTAICAQPKGLVQKTATGLSSGMDPIQATAECPDGTRVTGGGFHANDSDDEIAFNTPSDSLADGDDKPDDGWTAQVRPDSPGDSLIVTAVCSKRLKLKYVRNDLTGPSGVAVTAPCPEKTAVTGGGFDITGDAGATIHSSAPVDFGDADDVPSDGWRAQARVDSGSRTLFSFAICAKKP